MARLDRLASVKEVAQIGATIGREITLSLFSEQPTFEKRFGQFLDKERDTVGGLVVTSVPKVTI